ncbi:MAG TPA: D-alanyl-D-alanine carboxypeptidase [Candidatus Dormibacteraeota bacterium]|nr:D-alanyl-D-alanine carboxypeptidase [Candidatus Dormibacteraeota bacterium]
MRSSPRTAVLAGAAVLVAALLAWNALRPIEIAPVQVIASSFSEGTSPDVPWPDQGQAAVGAAVGGQGSGVLAASPNPTPQPTGSVAKVMTALVVLEEKPLQVGEQGPTIRVTEEDVQDYRQMLAQEQSVVPVVAGEALTEYQALQGLLLPSANNFALMLARWASGSLQQHLDRMTAEARRLGMMQTTFADASGFSPETRSTPSDLIRLGEAAMQNPVIARIVAQPQAVLPVAGVVYNVNAVLGQDGIVGIKTGNTPEAGGCYLFAATDRLDDGREILLFGAVQGMETLRDAFVAAEALLRVMRLTLEIRHIVHRYQVVGHYQAPWGASTDLVVTRDVDLALWPGADVSVTLHARPISPPVPRGATVGSLHLTVGGSSYDIPVVTVRAVPGPGIPARLVRTSW